MSRWHIERYRWGLWLVILISLAIGVTWMNSNTQQLVHKDATELTIAQGIGMNEFFQASESAASSPATAVSHIAAQIVTTPPIPGIVDYTIYLPPKTAKAVRQTVQHAGVNTKVLPALESSLQTSSSTPLIPFLSSNTKTAAVPSSILLAVWRHPHLQQITWHGKLLTFAPIIVNTRVVGLTLVNQIPKARAIPVVTAMFHRQFYYEAIGTIIFAALIYLLIGLWLIRPIRYQAEHDGLTGLTNQDTFWKLLPTHCDLAHTQQSSLVLAIADLDYFKAINDNHGHSTGDDVLKSFAQVLSHNVRQTDLVARVGGEEFAILFPDCSHQQAEQLADQIRSVWAQTHPQQLPVTCSIGLAILDPQESPKQFYKKADQALYEAKHRGRNQVFIAQEA